MKDYIDMCYDQGCSSDEVEDILLDLEELEDCLEQN